MITWVFAVVVKPAAPAATETEVQKKTGDKEAVVGTPGRRIPSVGCAVPVLLIHAFMVMSKSDASLLLGVRCLSLFTSIRPPVISAYPPFI